MAAAVEFNLNEIDAVKKLLARASLGAGDRAQLLRAVGAEAEAQTKERFETKVSPDGNTWKELAEKTAAYYAENGMTGGSLLVRGGYLRDSVTHNVEGGSWAVIVGATMEYAATHQFGATITPKTAKALAVPGYGFLKKVTIPARPYLGVSESDARELADLAAGFLARSIK